MLLSLMPAAAVFADTPGMVYLRPNANWVTDGARFAAYFYGLSDDWAYMDDPDGDGCYEAAVPDGSSHVIFCRMNGKSMINSWDHVWNQTTGLVLPDDGSDCYILDQGGWNGQGRWGLRSNDYYLFGYINGANYGCEEDHANLGIYKFANGQLTVTFDTDSYVGVKTGDNALWYMTDGWQGNQATSVTLYNSQSIEGPDKLFVPGGKQVTFTLTDNGDDTLTLTYTAEECSHSYTETVTVPATCTSAGVTTYTCSQCGHSYTQTIPVTGHKYSGGSCTACGAADPSSSSQATLVTNAASLTEGDRIIIVARNADFALSTTQNTSNRGKAAITKSGSTVICSAATQILTLETGAVAGTFGFNADGKYLYAASSYGDYLKSSATLSANASWSILIDSATGAATVTANGSSSHNVIRYASSGVFACCADSTAQGDICIYRIDGSIGCTHNYLWQVTGQPGCTTAGEKVYTCDACGDSYTEVLEATGHSFAGGQCTVCGALDSGYTATYYLFGHINGRDYACEDDFESTGIFKFTNGLLTASFDTDSYVGVKTGDNVHWYMTEGWQGNVSSAVLYNTSVTVNPDKLFVPGGVELTFTLAENADGTLTLSYFASSGTCQHLSHDSQGSCVGCGIPVGHSWVGGFCAGCGSQCSHSYQSTVTTAPTCDANGVKLSTCTLCADVITESIMATGHSFVDGKCSVCGASNTGATSRDYYLFGWINGENYACEEDWENLGVYKFVNGRLSAVFHMDSYIGVKSGDNAQWYLTDGWQGTVTSVTLHDTAVTLNPDKLFVPGGVQLTFTLAENADGTLQLTYTAASGSCQHLNHGTDGSCTTCGAAVDHSYNGGVCTVCGLECGHSWSSRVTAQATCDTNGLETFTCSLCAHSYTRIIAAAGHSFRDGQCVVCGADQSAFTGEYYLFGYINGADYGCEDDWENLGIYKFTDGLLTVTFEADSYIGVKTGDNANWYMTDGWQGVVNTVVLHNTAALFNADKLFLPGGVELTLRLTETAEDTLTLSYTVASDSCEHMSHDANGNCVACGLSVGHSWENGYCADCDTHCEHSYQDDVCTVCGAVDRSGTYYFFGYINGEDYAFEADWENLGIYKFVDGQLTATFETDSYIGIKTGDNLQWYMTQSFVTDTWATFYNTSTGVYEKMYVPGGVELTFTLTENPDGSLTLSYTAGAEACRHPSHGTDGRCADCGVTVSHSYTDARCTVCGVRCTHSYIGKITERPTCTGTGVRTYTCTQCASSYTEPIDATGHTYEEGECLYCGAAQPSPAEEFYLFGTIGGLDYGTGDDWENLGEYQFVDGRLTATFPTDSYIGIKTGDNARWFMTRSFTMDTAATFYDTTVGVYEKMYVPGGVELTFTLVENADGSLHLSYTENSKPTITLKYPTMSFKDEVKLNVYYEAVNLDGVVDMGLIVYSYRADACSVYNAEDVVPGYQYSSSAGLYVVSTNGIPAKNMGDTVWFAVYAKLSDGSYCYSKLVDYSPRTYAYTMLGSGDAKLDALLVALLNYGTEAQTYFGYNTGSLLNDQLTAAQRALVSAYSGGMMPNIAPVDADRQGSFAANGGFGEKYPSVTFGGAFAINYYCVPGFVPYGGITMYYWREADYLAADVLTAENAAGSVPMIRSGSAYKGSVTGISAKDISDGVYVAFVYSDGITTYSSGVLEYSIGMYCSTMAGYENDFTPLAQATAVYGYYAKQYFG